MIARLRSLKSSAALTITDALKDRQLLGAALGDPDSWNVWSAVLRAAFGLDLNRHERRLFRKVAGSRRPPAHRVSNLTALVGRRSGKTRMASAIAVFIAAIEQHRLAPGEVGYVLLLAMSRDQARTAFGYVLGFLERSPILCQLIESVTADEVRLKGNIIIGVHANSYRSIRGKSLLAVVADECSFWRAEDSATPDVETYRACVPALTATGGMWIAISTGYRKAGLLYEHWRDHFGKSNDDVLVVQGSTELFNATFSKAKIAKAKADDPEAAESEWGGQFRNDVSSFLDDATIDMAIDHTRPAELPPRPGIRYVAFTDVSGGRRDHFVTSVGHREGDRCVIDLIRGTAPPFDPALVVAQHAALLKKYGIIRLTGDAYAAEWASSAWRGAELLFERSPVNKSEIYLETLPIWVRGLISIPHHQRLVSELRLLERSPHRGGKDVIDHPRRNGHDDYSNSVCGVVHLLTAKGKSSYDSTLSWVTGDGEGPSYMSHWITMHQRPFGT